MQLEFTAQTAKLVSVNPRAEFHGDSTKPAVDLKFEMKISNDFLSELHPTLKHSLYARENEDQDDLLDGDHHLTVLRFAGLKGPLKWDWDGIGYTTHLDVGVTGMANIDIDSCKVGKINIDPQEGGTVGLGITVQAAAEGQLIGRLCDLLGGEVSLTLTPPTAEKLAEMNKPSTGTQELFPADAEQKAGISDEDQLAQAEKGLTAGDVFGTTEERAAKDQVTA